MTPPWPTHAYLEIRVFDETFRGMVISVALVVLLVLGLLASWGTRRRRSGPDGFLARIVGGADGRPSTSKAQFLVWSAVCAFSVVVVCFDHFLRGELAPLVGIPRNLMIAMGLSATTAIAAKGIAASYSATGRIDRPPVDPSPSPIVRDGGVVTDDAGMPDLAKLQMVCFTVIALGVYLARLLGQPLVQPLEFVDIDDALMVLMGLSQGAYVGAKAASVETPRITGVSNPAPPRGSDLDLYGADLGSKQDGNQVWIGNTAAVVIDWKPTRITCSVPAARADGTPWTPGERVPIDVIVGGRSATTQVTLAVT